MTKIPETRKQLERIASDPAMPPHLAADLRTCISDLVRDPAVRKAPTQSSPVTPQVKQQIKTLAANNPDMSMQDIADLVGVNIGRVSEVLNGKR